MSSVEVAFSERLQPFTPVLEASETSPALGSGGVIASRWGKVTDWVTYYGQCRFGAGSAPGAGIYRLSLPQRAFGGDAGQNALLGRGFCVQASTGTRVHLIARLDSPSVSFAVFDVFPGPGAGKNVMTNELPWSWSANDAFFWQLAYEAAAW